MTKWDSVGEWGRRMPGDRRLRPANDAQLDQAIADGAVSVLFQPWIDPLSGLVAGAEALARSPLAPSAQALFARAAAAGIAERLSRAVQSQALRLAANWSGPLANLHVSINLLPSEMSRIGHERWLLDEIAAVGIDPRRVTVEITESALLIGQAEVAERLGRLRAAGVRIALDDFGTGYASLAYLTTLPLDMIKIDGGLISGLVGGTRDQIVVKAMIRLARELGLAVLVEGVEKVEQLALLADWGCDLYQGFLGAGALSEAELARFVDASQRHAA